MGNEQQEVKETISTVTKTTLKKTVEADETDYSLKYTLKEAFTKLKQESGVSDLKFFSYSAFNLGSDGKTNSYTLAGFSPSKNKVYYVSQNPSRYKINDNTPEAGSEPTVDNINDLKDSKELVSEAEKTRGKCADTMKILISPVKNKPAEITCTKSKWGYETQMTD